MLYVVQCKAHVYDRCTRVLYHDHDELYSLSFRWMQRWVSGPPGRFSMLVLAPPLPPSSRQRQSFRLLLMRVCLQPLSWLLSLS